MGDLIGPSSALPARIGGVSASTGLPDNFADVTSAGQLLVKDGADGPVAPGTVASFSMLIGGQYSATLPTLTNTQQSAIQIDSSGRILLSPNSPVPTGVADESAFTYGTTVQQVSGGVYQDTSPTLTAGQQGAIRLTQYRGQHVNVRTSGGTELDYNFGAADASTLRVAALLGNASGIADFNAGTTTAQTQRVAANTYDGAGNAITSDNNGNANNQILHVATPDTTVASTALGALNATIQVAMNGLPSVGFQILTGTLIGTLTPECSIDGGTTWVQCNFYNPTSQSAANTHTFSAANATTVLSILPIGGSSHARVIVTAYTSGTANAIMRASAVTGPVVNTSISLPTTASKFSFGRLVTAAATQVPVEETTYTEQITNGQRSLASSNAGDIAGGTGARAVLITYYDQTGAGPFTESVSMNGTATANTVGTNICYIESLKVTSVGSAGSNQGTITLFTAINKGGTTIGTIAVGDTQTFWAHHYVPLGKTSYISGFSIGNNATSAGDGGLFVLKAATPTVANSQELQVSDFVTIAGGQNTDTRIYNSPIQVVGPARVRAYVTPYATSSTTQYASFDFIDN